MKAIEIRENGQIYVKGDYTQYYNERSDIVDNTCPVHFDDCELLDIDEDGMTLLPENEYAKILLYDACGNLDEAWDATNYITGNGGIIYEVQLLDGEGINIRWREGGKEDWQEGIWSVFCEKTGVELDALA